MLRLIGRERIFRCILRLGLRCGSRLLERLRLGHFAVNAAQGAVHAEQHHNKFIAEPCSNISDDKQQDRPEKVEKQQNNAVNSQRSDRHEMCIRDRAAASKARETQTIQPVVYDEMPDFYKK